MIIFEGPDGGGKTSALVRLSKDLGLPIAPKVVSADTKPMVNLREWTEYNLDRGFQRKLFDRHRLISEPIYGPAMRARQDLAFLDLGWMSEMTGRLYAANPIIVYCLPPLEVVRKNVFDDATNNEAVRGRIGAIYAGYVARASLDITRGVGKLYNYRTTPYSELMDWVVRELNKRDSEGYTHDHRDFHQPAGSVHR